MNIQTLRRSATVLLAAVLLAACSAAAPTRAPQPTAAPTTAPTQAAEPTKAPAPEPTATTAAPAASGSALKYDLVDGKTTASYSVREQLAKRDLPNDAVGSTTKVSGAIALNADGTVDAKNSKITVDAASLQTDEGMRDNYVRRNILLTDKFKEIVFVPSAVTGLPSPLPASGSVTFQLSGDLTIKDVTKPVTWDVTGTIDGDSATGTATTSFTFADFNLTQPKVPVVLSLVDKITLKIDLTLQKSK